MEQFTASEVRDYADACRLLHKGPVIADMLHAYADRLEADEKAKPVAWLEIPPGEQGDPYYTGYRFHGLTSLPFGRYDLFIRPVPTPADAERLAEALRFYANPEIYKSSPHGPAFDKRDLTFTAREALASHSIHTPWTDGEKAHFKAAAELVAQREATQAQPPAASVPDAVFPNRRACVPYENHPGKRIVGFVIDEPHTWWGKCGLTEPLSALEAALAARTTCGTSTKQTPDAGVPDGLIDALRHQRQIDECGDEVGVSRQAVDEAIGILAALAVQENPNGL